MSDDIHAYMINVSITYIYIYVCVCVCVMYCVYMYIYIIATGGSLTPTACVFVHKCRIPGRK